MTSENYYYATGTEVTSIADAIRTKTGTSEQLAFPEGFVDAIDGIRQMSWDDDVVYMDYDGTIVATYTKADFANLTAHPANPTHAGLTAQGWNWSLSDAKTYVATYEHLIIGQMYVTDDGKTRLYIHLEDSNLLSPTLYWYQDVADGVTIDWGDESNTETSNVAGNTSITHQYSVVGDYVITLNVTSNTALLGIGNTVFGYTGNTNKPYVYSLKKVEYGSNIPYIRSYTFNECNNLESITIPSSIDTFYQYDFYACESLKCIVIPSGTTSIPMYFMPYSFHLKSVSLPITITKIDDYAFSECNSLENITIPSAVTTIGDYAFNQNYMLKKLTLPSSVQTIETYAFSYCNVLKGIALPSTIKTIKGYAFQYCKSIESITIPNTVTTFGQNLFQNCYSLRTANILCGSVTNGTYLFSGCKNLSNVSLASGITSISDRMFYGCFCIKSLTIPSTVTSIGSSAFYNSGVAEYHFLSTTPPTLSNTNAFNNILSDCIIYVPRSENQTVLNAYKTASNWSTYASCMQEEPES